MPKESVFPSFKGSISLEAILVSPIFLLFVISILMSLEMIRLQTNVFEALHQAESVAFATEGQNSTSVALNYFCTLEYADLCLDGGVEGLNFCDTSSINEDGIIDLSVSYKMKPLIRWIPINQFRVEDSVYGHSFTGYETGGTDTFGIEKEEYVYVTESGTKYHRDSTCQFLRVTSMAVDASYLKKRRNNDGGKYYPCEVCNPSKTGILYITPEGDRFHSNKDCPSLKRTVTVVTLEEAVDNGYTPCSKCG